MPTRLNRLGAALGAVSLVLGFSGVVIGLSTGTAVATPTPPSTSSCTYQDTTAGGTAAQNFIPNVTPGDTIALNCSGLPASTSLAVAPASLLAGIEGTGESAQDFADIGAAQIGVTTTASGTLSDNFTWPATFAATNTSAACPPTAAQINAGVVGCTIAVATLTGTAENTGSVIFKSTTPAASTITATNTTGKGGDTVHLTGGSNWWPAGFSGAPNTALGIPAASLTFTDAAATTTVLSSVTMPQTVFCGTGTTPTTACTGKTANTLLPSTPPATAAVIPMTAATGAGQLCLTEADQWAADPSASTVPVLPGNASSGAAETACVSVTVLGAQTLVASPTSGGLGNTIGVTGTNWDPNLGSTAALSFACGSDTGSATVSASGALSGSITVGSTETACIPTGLLSTADNINATLGTETASAPFTVTGLITSCATSGAPNMCDTNQVVTQPVVGVTAGLLLNEGTGGTGVTMAPITLNGFQQVSTGAINPITLIDERGTLVGWSMTAQFQNANFTGPTAGSNAVDHEIPVNHVFLGDGTTATGPSVVCAVAHEPVTGDPSCQITEVTQPTANTAFSATSAISLGTAASGGGGGSFIAASGVQIYVPAFIAAGSYTDTLNLTVS